MNWGNIPQEMTDAAAQLQQAQKNLEKMVHDEIKRQVNLHCSAWRWKVATILREREELRQHLIAAMRGYSVSIEEALSLISDNDKTWFPDITPANYIKKLENS